MHVAFPEPSRRGGAWGSVLGAAAITLVLSGCGGSAEPANDASQAKPAPKVDIAPSPEPPKEEPIAFPTACANEGSELCVPPNAFVRRLCAAGMPEMALALFAKGTPWVRGYLARATEAWDASGGPSSSNKLAFEEEVLILEKRTPNTGGMVVSGASGSYDVLRWNGSCASLQAEEIRMRVPPEPLHAEIPWRKLDDDVQEALLKDEKIATRAAEQKKECKGVSSGQTNAKCEKAQKALGKAIVAFVRRGGALPPPPALP
ncbi:hypothetical protein [Polyangium fumosum]|uniref:Uncharacterized protein n=1 Tax=Polyangium fumosum TaxID=889272 RepID=A0A4U1J4C7_9BACT|nr:hypothetical protein [Polyangium fumosum]TKD02065.1 hypothetical protein E8A74_29840 [Polyangium fumosum]